MEVLTDAAIEEIKTRCCFVSEVLDASGDNSRIASPGGWGGDDYFTDTDPPSDATHSESEYSRVSMDVDSAAGESQAASSSSSVVPHPYTTLPSNRMERGGNNLQVLADLYMRHSTATDIQIRVAPPTAQQVGSGKGTLIIPGWIRERAAEVLFEGGDVDESSVAEVILDSLLKVMIYPSLVPNSLI
jgi:actin-related protein 10